MNLTDVENILSELQPLDIIEAVGLDDEPGLLVTALADHIEDTMDEIVVRLKANGLIEDREDDE